MAAPQASLSPATVGYSDEDHQTWADLCARQLALTACCGCQLFHEGFHKLQLTLDRLPDAALVSARLRRLSGWELGNAQNAYLSASEWFEHLAHFRFPVTNYIRRPHELDYTPMPDLFHEYFGHLPLLTDHAFADTAQMFGPLYLRANERQRLELARIWWFSIEFGLVREDGALKVLGAGLLSSPGELRHALAPTTPRLPFDIRQVAQTPSAPYGYHEAYFILDDAAHVRRIIQAYARMEGLPVPQPAL